jgi:thiol-disulfide isomerase/thioredoxin
LNVLRISWSLALSLLLVSALVAATGCSRGGERISAGKAGFDFSLPDLQGAKVSLSDFRGKVVLVEFWATWCPPCRESIPELTTLSAKYADRGLVLLAISVDKGGDVAATVSSFAREHGVTYPVLLDDGKVNTRFGVTSIPALFLIDKNGALVKQFTGFIPGLGETIAHDIEAIL